MPNSADTAALTRHVLAGQLGFILMMLSCCAIEPSRAAIDQGLSYYGNRVETIGPYTAAFALVVGLTTRGLARFSSRDDARAFCVAVGGVLALMVPIPLTPYDADTVLDWLHLADASALFAAGYVVGAWLALRFLRGRDAFGLLAALSVAGLAIAAAAAGLHHYMIPAEIGFQIVFAALVVQASRSLARGVDARNAVAKIAGELEAHRAGSEAAPDLTVEHEHAARGAVVRIRRAETCRAGRPPGASRAAACRAVPRGGLPRVDSSLRERSSTAGLSRGVVRFLFRLGA